MAANSGGEAGEIEVLEYPVCPDAAPAQAWNGWVEVEEEKKEERTVRAHGGQFSSPGDGADERLDEEPGRSFEAGRARGREEGRQAEREMQAAARIADQERLKRQMAGLVERFDEAREQYLHSVEQEVVRLALAVAARILRREAEMDPLLLTGAVRVALGQLTASSKVRLLVPAAELGMWKEAIGHLPNLRVKPAVVLGEEVAPGGCVIESEAGSVELGIRSQLKEIERGFFDRVDAGPACSPAARVAAGPDEQEEEQE